MNILCDPTSAPQSLRLQRNNFDALRLLAAAVVCVVHTAELSGFPALAWLLQVLSSAVAVKAFFVMSGFLICMSFERSSSLRRYIEKRVRRLYPAYVFVIALCAFGLFFVSTAPASAYFSGAWWRYVAANLTFLNFLQPTLVGVFEQHPLPTVNGALWTLKVEVMFYACVPLIVYAARCWGYLRVLVALYVASVAYSSTMQVMAERTGSGMYVELERQLPGQLSYFVAGAFFYYFLPWFERYWRFVVGAAVLVWALNGALPLSWLMPFALATGVVFCGLFGYLGNVGRYGDFSYGLYMLHFPVIQLLLLHGGLNAQPGWFVLVALTMSVLGAVLLWHGIEKRFLFRQSHYLAGSA